MGDDPILSAVHRLHLECLERSLWSLVCPEDSSQGGERYWWYFLQKGERKELWALLDKISWTVLWGSDYIWSLLLQGGMDGHLFESLQVWFCRLFLLAFAHDTLTLCVHLIFDCEFIFLGSTSVEILWGLELKQCSSRGYLLLLLASTGDTPDQVCCIHSLDL